MNKIETDFKKDLYNSRESLSDPIGLRMPEPLLELIDEVAEENGLTRSYVIRKSCLRQLIKGMPEERGDLK